MRFYVSLHKLNYVANYMEEDKQKWHNHVYAWYFDGELKELGVAVYNQSPSMDVDPKVTYICTPISRD